MKIVKSALKVKMIFGLCKALTHGQIKRLIKIEKIKKLNIKIMIEQFFKLTGIKKTKVLFSLNHGWKYSSNSKPLRIKSYWNSSLKSWSLCRLVCWT